LCSTWTQSWQRPIEPDIGTDLFADHELIGKHLHLGCEPAEGCAGCGSADSVSERDPLTRIGFVPERRR
jgi:hypothetical protein